MTLNKLMRLVTLGTSLAIPSLASAQTTPPPAPPEEGHGAFTKVREACHDDVERLCHDVKPGRGQIRECLKAHESELSTGCRAAIEEARAHHRPRG
jgi:hypothetical protein